MKSFFYTTLKSSFVSVANENMDNEDIIYHILDIFFIAHDWEHILLCRSINKQWYALILYRRDKYLLHPGMYAYLLRNHLCIDSFNVNFVNITRSIHEGLAKDLDKVLKSGHGSLYSRTYNSGNLFLSESSVVRLGKTIPMMWPNKHRNGLWVFANGQLEKLQRALSKNLVVKSGVFVPLQALSQEFLPDNERAVYDKYFACEFGKDSQLDLTSALNLYLWVFLHVNFPSKYYIKEYPV